MDNLSTMYNNGMGSLASINMGRQMVADRQVAAEDLRTKQLANDQAAVMNPLNAQFKQGEIARQGAELPGIVGNSQVHGAAGQEAAATSSAKIAAKLSSLSTQIGNDGMVKMGQEGQLAVSISKALDNYPPHMHRDVVAQAAKQYGVDPNNPLITGILNGPPDQIKDGLLKLGTGMALASHEFIQKQTLQSQHLDSTERVAKGNNETSIKVAEIAAASREAAANARAAAMKHIPKTEDKIALLEQAEAEGTASPAESDLLRRLKTHVYTEKAMPANALPAQVIGGKTPVQNAQEAAGAAVPRPAPAAQAAPQLPAGYKQVGTSKGIPVYEGPDGKRYLWGK